jgi:hypothetical protein
MGYPPDFWGWIGSDLLKILVRLPPGFLGVDRIRFAEFLGGGSDPICRVVDGVPPPDFWGWIGSDLLKILVGVPPRIFGGGSDPICRVFGGGGRIRFAV